MSGIKIDVLVAPQLTQAKDSTLKLSVIAKEGIKVCIPVYEGMEASGQQAELVYAASPGNGSVFLFPAQNVEAVKPFEMVLDAQVVRPEWKFLAVSYRAAGRDSDAVIVSIVP